MQFPELKDLHIRITSKCNFNCPHCYASTWFSKKDALSFQDFKSLIFQAIPLGVKKVTFTGGEPLTYKYICDAIKLCMDSGLRVEIETNGSLIEILFNKIKNYLKKIEFSISYDGENMRPSSYNVRENIVKLASMGCSLKLQTVLTLLNISEIDDILMFSQKLKIKNRVFLTHSPTGNGENLKSLDFHECLSVVKKIKLKYAHAVLELPDVLSGGSQKKCGWGIHRCEIMPNGDVTSCGPIAFNDKNFVAGNIKKSNLKEIWCSDHFCYIRNLKQKDFTGLCSKCIFWETCLGACRSISYSVGGNLLSSHPFCDTLFASVKNKSVDLNLIPDVDRVLRWIKEIENSNFLLNKLTLKEIVL